MSDTTNPGCVNVANQDDGLVSVDQTKSVSYSGQVIQVVSPSFGGGPGPDFTDPGLVNVMNESLGKGLSANINVS